MKAKKMKLLKCGNCNNFTDVGREKGYCSFIHEEIQGELHPCNMFTLDCDIRIELLEYIRKGGKI